MKAKGYLYGCISSATYGMIPLFVLPVMAKGIKYDSILFYRYLLAALSIALLMKIRKESFDISRKDIIPMITMGLLYASSSLFYFWGYSFMAAGLAATILFMYPVFVTILMATFFHEKVAWITILAITLAFTGVGLLYLGDGQMTLNPTGVIIILLSAFTYALSIIIVNKSSIRNMAGSKLTFYTMVTGSCMFFVQSETGNGLQFLPDWQSWTNVLLLAIVPTVVSCVTMVYSVHYIGSTATAVLGALEPVTAVCIGVLIFNEAFTFSLATGIILIIISVMLIILSKNILKNMTYLRRKVIHLALRR